MSKARLRFYECTADSQELGSNDEHMVSRVYFDLEVGTKKFEGLHADLKQTVGSDFETAAIEVTPPQGYEGPLDYCAFRDLAIRYYRDLVSSQGRVITVRPGASLRLQNTTFRKEMIGDLDVPDSASPW